MKLKDDIQKIVDEEMEKAQGFSPFIQDSIGGGERWERLLPVIKNNRKLIFDKLGPDTQDPLIKNDQNNREAYTRAIENVLSMSPEDITTLFLVYRGYIRDDPRTRLLPIGSLESWEKLEWPAHLMMEICRVCENI